MNIKICTVVTGKNLNDFLKNLEQIQAISNMVELRVDYISNLKLENIQTIKSKIKKETIFTCRKKQEGGEFQGSEKERVNIILEAIKLGFDYVDIELSSCNSFSFPKKINSKIICSFHDFKKTPSLKNLQSTLEKMNKYKIDIKKIATFINCEKDIQNLFYVLIHRKANEKIIAIGMGEKGKITRILGPLLGSFLTFASTNKTESAPGQINIIKLKQLWQEIHLDNCSG
ncbi:MAG: type I 3-dehydroquinate dehydratase [bacterium]|nr:type I 3-dehydroquinate dehydratase [bacterium]